MRVHLLALAASLAAGLFATATFAQTYPEKAVQIVVPAGAGGGSDVLIRTVQPYLEKELGADVVVLNVAGAGSVAGSRRIVDEEPDGYNVLTNHTTLLTAIALGKADFTLDDLELVVTAVEMPLVVAVPADSPYNNIAELAAASVNSSDPVISGVNLGALNHFAMLLIENKVGDSNLRYVQTGGGAKTSAALLGGHIAVGVLAGPEALPLLESNDIKLIAALSENRIDYLPDVATAKEQGIDAVLGISYSWYMPKGTPQDRQDKFAAAVEAALQNADLIADLKKRGIVPTFVPSDKAAEMVAASLADLQAIADTLK